jgi:tripartite-type tricarboxylate transporter receptor subunit TctC
MRHTASRLLVAACLAVAMTAPATAEDAAAFPSRPIKIIVPGGAGAGIDVGCRMVSEVAEKYLGQRLVVENRPGGGSRVGASVAAKSTPDGYTLLYSPKTPITIVEHLSLKLDYDPGRDLTPVSIITWAPGLLVVRQDFPAKTMREFVAYAKDNPGQITFGIQGIGSEYHVALETLRQRTGVKIIAVAYNVAAQAIVDMLAGRLDAMILVPAAIKEHIAAGRLRALATLDPKRVPDFPDVPAMAEAGLPEVTSTSWFGYLAPSGTPPAILNKLADAFAKTQAEAALVQRLAAVGYTLRVLGPAEFGAILTKERTDYAKVAAGGRLDNAN